MKRELDESLCEWTEAAMVNCFFFASLSFITTGSSSDAFTISALIALVAAGAFDLARYVG